MSDKYTRLELTIYCVCWAIVFCVPLIAQSYSVLIGEASGYRWSSIMRHWGIMAPIFLLFVINNWVLLPQLFWKKRNVLYFLALICLFALLWHYNAPHPPHIEINTPNVVSPHMENMRELAPAHPLPPPPHREGRGVDMFRFTNLIIGLCAIFANFGIKLYIHSLRRDVQMLNIQNEKMLQELKSLKYQINPHFLMNTLNNIQSLIEIAPQTASKTIQQLSKLMRYALYDNNTQSVELEKEVEFMRNYIELMRIRYPETLKISADFPTENTQVHVPPLLFISFLENAFKYGVSYTEDSLISVKLQIEKQKLLFTCANYISETAKDSSKRSGIGLTNVRRRLDLIYGDSYSLEISQMNNTYIVEMCLPI